MDIFGRRNSVCITIVILSIVLYYIFTNFENRKEVENIILVIGITSAQENFNQRQAIRSTWVKLIKSEIIKYYFIIGDTFCSIPQKYRLSPLSCQEWIPVIRDDMNETTVFYTIGHESTQLVSDNAKLVTGFSFILNHDIILKHFGIKTNVLSQCKGPVQIVLKDAVTRNKIVSSTFTYDSEKEITVWKKIPKLTLPAGFEGKFTIEGECSLLENDVSCLSLMDKTNTINFLFITYKNRTVKYIDNHCIGIGFSFTIKNISYIRNLINNKDKEKLIWQQQIQSVTHRLSEEINNYQDIILINEIIDIYSNLPVKMLKFYQWVLNNHKKFEYFLKTDDDVFVNIPKVIRELLEKKTELQWWSCFRTNWPVQRCGKWREMNLNLTVYPIFPSGAGYVLNYKLIKYIVDNVDKLYIDSQGEDVSIGLWLDDLNPKIYTGNQCHWSCNKSCNRLGCNLIELNIFDVMSTWEKYQLCNNTFCWCPN